MRKQLTLFLLVFLPVYLSAQDLITVEPPSGASSTYTDLQAALDAAPSGSKVIVSGGAWSASNGTGYFVIDKRVHLLGAGFEVDSTKATRRTNILATIQLGENSDGTIIEGIDLQGSITNYLPNIGNSSVSNITIKSIRANNLSFGYDVTIPVPQPEASNLFISNSLIGSINLGYARGVKITNSIFYIITALNGQATIENNIFNQIGGCAANTLFRNNIITYGFSDYNYCGFYCTCFGHNGNYFYNNIFSFPKIGSIPESPSEVAQGNKYEVDMSSIFQVYDPALASDFHYNYKQFDFHIKPGSAADNAGTDGTDIGIYGSGRPWKEGAVPSNPHIQSKTIAPETDAQGRLNVNIRVKAQGN